MVCSLLFSRSKMTVKAVKMPCTTPNVYTKVPDGGWGWAIAVAFFFVEALTYGVIKSFGVFFNDLMESFDETNSRISWIISICVFVQTFTGKSKGQEPEGTVLLLTQHVEARDQGLVSQWLHVKLQPPGFVAVF